MARLQKWGERGAVSAAPLSEAPFCSAAPAELTPSGESMGKGDWACSLPATPTAGWERSQSSLCTAGLSSCSWVWESSTWELPLPQLGGLGEGL